MTAGVQVREFTPAATRDWRGTEGHSLHVVVWYPAVSGASETQQSFPPGDKGLFLAGYASPKAALIAPSPTLSKVPLIVLSHGSGGSAEQLAWLGVALARAGMIVAAVDHPGNNSKQPYTPAGMLLWGERATDLSDVIDGMLADPQFSPRIDRTRIGAAGFSLGGYTVLELAGARTDFSRIEQYCGAHAESALCNTREMQQLGGAQNALAAVRATDAVGLARAGESFADPRVKALFLMAPAPAMALTEDSLREVHLPVMIVVGAQDPIATPATNANYLKAHIPGAQEAVLQGGVDHYTFLDSCTDRGRHDLGSLCKDAPGLQRDRVHANVGVMAIRFFDRALKIR